MRPPTSRTPRAGFTLVEILVVVVIISILAALLVPAIAGAMRSARNASVTAEINNLSTALANFKSQFGDYPPSRVILTENGFFNVGGTTALSTTGSDITDGQLNQRTVSFLKRFWPRMNVSTTSSLYTNTPGGFLDFNGNGTMDASSYVLEGHECLVFFLGGMPANGGLSGFGKNPVNPFDSTNTANRSVPFYEFKTSRLAIDPGAPFPSSIPGYLDALANPVTSGTALNGFFTNPGGAAGVNFYAYFSSYGNNQYDPNDVNFIEADDSGTTAAIALDFQVGYVETHTVTTGKKTSTTTDNIADSLAPNPYTSTLTNAGRTPTFLNPNSFQIISSGVDGLYGVGGQYLPGASGTTLPVDGSSPSNYNSSDTSIRLRERDNLSNFTSGRLN